MLGFRKGLLLGLAIVIGCVGCGKDRREDSAGAEPRYDLSGFVKPGAYASTVDLTIKQKLKADKQKANVDITIVMWADVEVDRIPDSQDMLIHNRFNRVTFSMSGAPGMGKVSIDTSKPDQARDQVAKSVLEEMSKLIGLQIDEVISPGGKASRKKIVAGNAAAAAKSKLDSGNEPTILSYTQFLPKTPVGKGAIWHCNIATDIGGGSDEVRYEAECELIDIRKTGEGKIAVIEWVGHIEQDKLKMDGGTAEDVDLTIKGEMELHIETLVIKKIAMSGEGTMDIRTGGETVRSDMTILGEVTMTPKPGN